MCSTDCLKYNFSKQCAWILIKTGWTKATLYISSRSSSKTASTMDGTYKKLYNQVQFATNKTEQRNWSSFLMKLQYYSI